MCLWYVQPAAVTSTIVRDAAWEENELQVWIPESSAACEVASWRCCICFSSANVWLGSSFSRVQWGVCAGRKWGEGGHCDFVVWANRPLVPQQTVIGLQFLSLLTGKRCQVLLHYNQFCTLSRHPPHPPSPSTISSSRSTPASSSGEIAQAESVVDIFWNCLWAYLVRS